jgi:hypothetical protein
MPETYACGRLFLNAGTLEFLAYSSDWLARRAQSPMMAFIENLR